MSNHWDELKDAIASHATGNRTAKAAAIMAKCAKEDPKRYASINADAMRPIRAAQDNARAEAPAKAEAEEAERKARLEARAKAQRDNLMSMIDQRVSEKMAGKPRKR